MDCFFNAAVYFVAGFLTQSYPEHLTTACCSSSSPGLSLGDLWPAQIFQSLLSSFWGWWHRERRAQEISSCVRAAAFLDPPNAMGRKTLKGMQRCLLGAARQGPGDGAGTPPHFPVCGTDTHPLPCGTGSLEHYRDWKEKKKKEILVVLISNRKWYIFFLKFFAACKWKGHTAEKQNCFSLPLFRFLLWGFIPILQIKIPQSCNESGFWRNGS